MLSPHLSMNNEENNNDKTFRLPRKRRNIQNEKLSSQKILLNKDLGVSVTEIARIIGKSRSTIYKVLKEELGYVLNRLVKNDR